MWETVKYMDAGSRARFEEDQNQLEKKNKGQETTEICEAL